MVRIPDKYKDSKKVYVETLNIATQAGHPRVYYKIDPKIGFVVCGYTNTCFILSDRNSDVSEKLLIYDGG